MLLDQQETPKRKSVKKTILSIVFLLPFLAALAVLIRMPLVWTDQVIFGGLLVSACIVVGRLSGSRLATSALMFVSIFCTLRYIVWRWTSTVSYLNDSSWNVDHVSLVFALLLLCAESYAVLILLLGYFQSARPLKRRPVPLPDDPDQWPSVDVFIPTYNESLEVVRPTVLAAMGIDWPADRLHVYILDDGRRPEFKEFAAECGAGYLTRSDNAHAKAGNINSALPKTTSEYIAIFDCDHIATRSFLQLTMGWFFKDKRLAMVQTPHHFYSPDPFERNLNVFKSVPNEGALFYGVVQDGNDTWNATFFCGSCAVIKREALEQVGGIAVETVTEDAHTALRLQKLGWNTAYIAIPQAAGLATGSLSAHVGQRIRWARGMVQILRTEFPLFARGLTLPQRLCYLNCAVHYLYAIPRLVFVTSPLVYLLLGRSNVYGVMWEIVAYAAPHLVLSSLVNSRSQGDHRHSFWNEVYEIVLAPYILLPTTLALINPKWGKFNVTAKESVVDHSFFDWRIARPYILLLALNLTAIIIAIPRYVAGADPTGVLAVNVLWAIFNSLLLGVAVAVSFEAKQQRATARVEVDLSATLTVSNEEPHHCRLIDMSEGGMALRSDRAFQSASGEPGMVEIHAAEKLFRFKSETVRTSGNRIHVRLIGKDIRHQREVTQLVYGRADSWLDWKKDQRRDRMLSSLVQVLGIGATGIWILPSLLIKRESKPAKKLRSSAVPKGVVSGLLLMMLIPHFCARAADVPSPVAVSSANTSESFRDAQTFTDLGRATPLNLRGTDSTAGFAFSIPTTKLVDSADLSIHYAFGSLKEGTTYRVVVRVNDVAIDSFALAGDVGSSPVAHLSVPSDLLVHENSISFQLRTDCVAPCKNALDSEAWARIEPASTLSTTGLAMPLPNRISMLPAPFFDSSVRRSLDIPIVFDTEPDAKSLTAAGIVSSWYGSMAGYRGAHFKVYVGQIPKGNVILLATSKASLAESLGLNAMEPQIAICDNPSDRYGKVLAIVGNAPSDLVSAARFLAQNRFQADGDHISLQPEQLTTNVRSQQTPPWSDTAKPIRITNDLTDNLLHARINSPTRLYFRVAPDLDYGTKQNVPLQLNFRLAGLSGDDHVWLSIRLNNTFVTRRRLGKEDCEKLASQKFAIPVSLIYPGNTLDIRLTTDRSDITAGDPAAVDLQILPSSTIDLQNPSRLVRMPRLDLFAAAGYPFSSQSDLRTTTVVVPTDPTTAQIGLYLDALAFIGSQTQAAATNVQVATPNDLDGKEDQNFLVISSGNDEASFRRFERLMPVIPANGHFELANLRLSWSEWFSTAWFTRNSEKEKLAAALQAAQPPTFLMEQFRSPYRSDGTVLILATGSEADDEPYFDRLAQASRDGAIRGSVVLAGSNSFSSYQLTSESFVLGDHISVSVADDFLRFHIWIVPLFVLAVAFAAAKWWEEALSHQVLKRLGNLL